MKSLFIVLSFSFFSCIPEINNKQAIDSDGDGFTALDGDCDDQSSQTFPGAAYLDSLTDCMTDLDGDGMGEVFWKTLDGDVYLRSIHHFDGNIQYANYMSKTQFIEYAQNSINYHSNFFSGLEIY